MREDLRKATRAELERVLASPQFAGAPRLAAFLRLVVEMALDGRGEEIKEYLIGTEVYQRGVDFDPKIDSIVRVEAYRLRARLDQYYAALDRPPAVRIELPKGSYVPRFQYDASPPPAADKNPEAAPVFTRRWWVSAAAAGTLGVAGGALWLARKRDRSGGAVIHLHAAGGEASAAGAFRLRLAHQLGRLLPGADVSAAEQIRELRASAGAKPAAPAYALVLCGEASGASQRFCIAAEAGATAAETVFHAMLAEFGRADIETAASGLADQIAAAVRRAGQWDRAIPEEARRGYLEVVEVFRRGRDSLLLTPRELETPWPLDELLQGIARLQNVTNRQPNFAAAWAQQAWLCTLAASYDKQLFDRAAESAHRALALDANVWKAHFNLGYVQFFQQRLLRDAAESLARAISIAPLRLEIVRYYADFLAIAGRADEAAEKLGILLAVIPRHRLVRLAAAALAYQRRDFAGMRQLTEGTLALEPELAAARWQRALAREQLGDAKGAEQDLREALRGQPGDHRAASALAHLLASQGRRAEAWRLFDDNGLGRLHYLRALVHAGSGETGPALAALQRSFQAKEFALPYYAADPRFTAIRDSAAGRQLLADLMQNSASS